jgi:hypothetical protein
MAIIKELAKEQRSNFVWLLLSWIGAAIMSTSILAALLHWLQSTSLDLKLILGLFLLSLALLAVAYLIGKRQRNQQGNTHASEKEQASPLAANESCPDKWLHDIVDKQKGGIRYHIHVVEPQISQHELFRDSPYIDFIFTCENNSVFPVCLYSLGGSIYFNSRLLNGTPKWTDNTPKNIRPLEMLSLVTLRQELSKEDVIFILNGSGDSARFSFGNLEIGVRSPDHPEVEPQMLMMAESVTNEKLLEAYPKLKITIQKHEIDVSVNLSDWSQPSGAFINMMVSFVNPRTIAVQIKNFVLVVKIAEKTYLASAEGGDIYSGGRFINKEGDERVAGEKLKNLNMGNEPFITAEQYVHFDGWLQFMFKGTLPNELDRFTAKLIIRDVSGEEHPAEFQLKKLQE